MFLLQHPVRQSFWRIARQYRYPRLNDDGSGIYLFGDEMHTGTVFLAAPSERALMGVEPSKLGQE